MNRVAASAFLLTLAAALGGCAATSSKQQVLAAGSQVEVRSYQTRTYDTDDRIRVLRAVMSTLQDLRFVIDKADDAVGIVSATKLDGYALTMSVSVRAKGAQTQVRANAQMNLKAIEQPGPYQDFFRALDKGLFLDDNLLVDNVPTHAAAARKRNSDDIAVTEGAYEFYGEAEAEIETNQQDRDLWARALVLVDGNEDRRKARYIELRAEQMFAEQEASRPVLPVSPIETQATPSIGSVDRQPEAVPVLDLSGVYESDITSNTSGIFGPRYRRLTLRIEQQGDRISAIDERFDTRLRGEIEGDTIRFEVDNGIASGHYPARGEWRIVDGGRQLTGSWHTHGGWTDARGEWNLMRVN